MEQAVEPKDDKVNSFNFLCIDFCRFYVDFRIKFLEVLRICCFTWLYTGIFKVVYY
jgi:hypothetical protein